MVSARKVKARLDKTKIAELKKKNVDKQAEMALSAEEARALSDDLVKSTIAGFEQELQKSSPAMKQLAANLSGMIQEFFIGFKQGVDAELKTFVKDTGKTLSKTVGDMNVAVTENVERLPEALKDSLESLKKEEQEVIPSLPGPEKPESYKPQTKEQKTEQLISDVLKRPTEADSAAKSVLGKKGSVKDWLTRAGYGSLGMEATAEKIISQRQQKEVFVKTESKLREKEFEGKSPEETRKILEEQFKVISETTEKLREIEKEISSYKELGYSEDQAEKLAGGEKQALTEKLIAADPSRLGKYKGAESPVTTVPVAAPAGPIVPVSPPGPVAPAAPVSEETMMEQAQLDEEAAKQRDTQTTLLSEIRDLLKAPKQGVAATNQPAATDGGVNVDIDLPRRIPPIVPTKGGPRPRSGKLPLAAKFLGGVAALGLGGYAAYQGFKGAEEEGAVSLQQIKEATARGEITKEEAAAQTKQIENTTTENKGGALGSGLGTAAGAIGGAKVGAMLGSFLGPVGTVVGGLAGGTIGAVSGSSVGQNIGGLIGKGVAGAKGFFGGEPTIQDAKTPDISQNKVELQSNTPSELEQRRAKIVAMATPGESAFVTKGREKTIAAIDREIAREKAAGGTSTQPSPQTNAKEYMIDSRQIPAPVEKKGFFSGLVDKAKNLFGIGNAPTVEAKPAKEAGPNWKATLSSYAENSTPVTSMEQQYPGISKKYIELAKKSVPRTDNIQSIETHEQMLKTRAIGEMSKGKGEATAVPTTTAPATAVPTTAPANLEKTSDNSGRLQEAAIARENGVSKPLPASVKEATPDASAKQAAAEIGKNIVVQSPPVVVSGNGGGQSQTVAPPFTNNTRNRDPSISDYLRSRYAY